MTLCYKQFTSIVSSLLKKTVTPKSLSGRQSISLESTSALSIPMMQFLSKNLNQAQGTDCFTKNIKTFSTTKTVKETAKIKDSSLYPEIVDIDLTAKEFKYHQVFLSGDRLIDGTDAKNNEDTNRTVNEEEN